jgi:hypothetical protein
MVGTNELRPHDQKVDPRTPKFHSLWAIRPSLPRTNTPSPNKPSPQHQKLLKQTPYIRLCDIRLAPPKTPQGILTNHLPTVAAVAIRPHGWVALVSF